MNMTGLDASLGFVHEDKPATTPLVYDFQEPYRWLVDYTVLRMVLFENVLMGRLLLHWRRLPVGD
jgi:CRISPR-associated protein Cas1